MASRCFAPTPAFQEKERQLRQLIDDENKEKLREDMENLFKDPRYSDLVLSVNSRQLPVHLFILKARCPQFYDHCMDHASDKQVNINNLCFEDVERFLSSVYSKDSINCLNVDKALSLNSSKSSPTTLSADLLSLVNASSGDVDFVVEGKVVKGHKAILSARCDYFAAMFSSSWKETSSSAIVIPDASYEIFVAALQFLYGVSQVAVLSLKTFKVLQFADMYAMQGLQNLVCSHLKITKCHLFHKPCQYCIPQVYECLKFCEVFYALEALKSRCIQWIAKNFVKTLPCKQFFLMPERFQDDVRSQIEKQISDSTALELWTKCAVLMSSAGSYQAKWKCLLQDFVHKIQASCINVILDNFVSICQSPVLVSFLKEINYSSPLLEQFLHATHETLTVQNCCSVLQGLLVLTEMTNQQQGSYLDCFDSETFAVVEKSCKRCEKFIISNIGQVAKTKAWMNISASKQKQLKDAAFFVDL